MRPRINWELNVSVIITLVLLAISGLSIVMLMPQKINAEIMCEVKDTYVRKDVYTSDQKAIAGQIKVIYDYIIKDKR